MNRNTDIVYRALKGRADDRGYVRVTLAQLTTDTALSMATVRRLLQRLVDDGQIEKRSKGGASGGLLIRLRTCSEPAQKPAQKPAQNEQVRNVSTQDPPPSGAGVLLQDSTCSEPAQTAEKAEWFVCCIWRDENYADWCHGADGIPTYIPCESKEVALYVADQHRYQPHKDREASLPSRPAVDIVRSVGKSKVLVQRLGVLDDGRPGEIDNPWTPRPIRP